MAYTEFASGGAQARIAWSEHLFRESFGKMQIKPLIGTAMGSCIQLLTDLKKTPGDQIKFDLLAQDRSDGVNGDTDLEGFEAALTYYQDTLKIDQKRHAHSFKGMSQQRTVHNLRKDGRHSLSEWMSWFFEGGILAHLAGVAGTGNETVAGALAADTGGVDFAGNTITAPDAAHLRATATTAVLANINDLVALAKVANPRIAPLMIDGAPKYVLLIHPYTTRALQIESGAAGWASIQQNAGSRGSSNPIYTGALGEYNGVIIRESECIPRSGTDLTHNLFLGAGAGAIAFGNAWKDGAGGSGSYFDWKEQERDYGNKKGIAAVTCVGFKGSQFNSQAFGRIVWRTTDAAPA